MSHGSIFKNIMMFSFPLILTNVLQLLYNAADVIVVGRWAGTDALASVGSTSSLTNLVINLFVGLSLGAGVVVSRKYGSEDNEGMGRAVHTAVLLGFIAGIIAMIFGEAFSEDLLVLMGTPYGKVLDGAALYMHIIFIGIPASLVYNFGAAILRSVGDTRRPLYILTFTGIVNVVLNLVFVIVFDMGVSGVATATVIANYLSAIAVIYSLVFSDSVYKVDLKKLKLYKKEFTEILKIGLPAGIQGAVFSLSNIVIQSAVNSFGTAAIAGNSAAASIDAFIYVAMNSFYQATITSVSQNYGAKNERRIYRTIWVSLLCVTVCGLLIGSLVVVFSKYLVGIYIKDSLDAISCARERLFVTCLPYFLCGIMEIFAGVLRGLGYSTFPAVNSLIGACGFRILWVKTILPVFNTMRVLYICWPVSWLIVVLMHIVCFLFVRKKSIQNMLKS